MKSENIKIEIKDGVQELVIREGEASIIRESQKVNIEGVISSPAEYFAKRKTEIESKKCHVLFSYLGMYIKLVVNESDYFATIITGKAKLNPELEKFGVNNPNKTYTVKELKQFLKMNRVFFNEVDENIKIVTNLEKFRASIQTQIDQHSSDRGNKKENLEVVVDTNLDLRFVLAMPIFIGQPNSVFNVEICCSVTDGSTTIWLESPELQQLIVNTREEIINNNIECFKESFVVIEQ